MPLTRDTVRQVDVETTYARTFNGRTVVLRWNRNGFVYQVSDMREDVAWAQYELLNAYADEISADPLVTRCTAWTPEED